MRGVITCCHLADHVCLFQEWKGEGMSQVHNAENSSFFPALCVIIGSQEDLMLHDECILVDFDDNVVGEESSYAHLICT